MTRDAGDPRVAYFDHGGRRVTVRLVDPQVPRSGKLSPRTRVIAQVPPAGPTREPVVVTGWVAPATFEAHGLTPGLVRFTISPNNPFAPWIVIRDLAIAASDPRFVPAWKWRDVPLGKLLRAALLIATADVRYTPSKPGTTAIRVMVGRDERTNPPTPIYVDRKGHRLTRDSPRAKWRAASPRIQAIALGGRAHDRDLSYLETGRRPKRGDVAHYLSPAALREVAREYAMAPPQDARPGVGIETWIGARTRRAPGTVRRQITEARRRGYLIAPVPSIAARRAQRAAGRKAYAAARKARGR
jgi:hypothetical protein